MPEMPALSPLMAGDLVCNTCGLVMERKVIMNNQGVAHIEYSCQNADKGCSYKVESRQPCNLQTMMIPTPKEAL